MTARERAKLQRMIDRTVATANAFHVAQETLNEWCADRYGYEPGDIDADQIIDGIFGACGLSNGMTADEFDQIMKAG